MFGQSQNWTMNDHQGTDIAQGDWLLCLHRLIPLSQTFWYSFHFICIFFSGNFCLHIPKFVSLILKVKQLRLIFCFASGSLVFHWHVKGLWLVEERTEPKTCQKHKFCLKYYPWPKGTASVAFVLYVALCHESGEEAGYTDRRPATQESARLILSSLSPPLLSWIICGPASL